MIVQPISVAGIPALLYGEAADHVYICVHGKMGSKRDADGVAAIAVPRGWQVLSFDLPDHGDRKCAPVPGEVKNRCTVQEGVRDLRIILAYARERWAHIALFACSIGAYFSLMAFQQEKFERCLFQSPVLDMPHLIRKMFLWFGVDEERLEREGEIETPVDVLSWPYYSYAMTHPVEVWASDTRILFGGRDDLQDAEIPEAFAARFGAALTIEPDCDHPFNGAADRVQRWLQKNI